MAKQKSGKAFIWILIVLIIIIIGVVIYFWLFRAETYLIVKDISPISKTIEIAIASGRGINNNPAKLQNQLETGKAKATEIFEPKEGETKILELNSITYIIVIERLDSEGNDGEKSADIKINAQEIKNVMDGNLYKIK